MKILVVDDKEENRYMVETLFKESGYEVVTAANGREALVILHAEKIDLIISDCLMPVMDGFELCRQCKADETLKNIPFVFCTASYVDKKDEEFGLELGAAEYVIKPFEPEDFIKTIEGVIERAKTGKISKIKPALEDNALFQMYNERLMNKLAEKVSALYAENERCNLIEKELRVSENNFHNSIENSPLGIRIVTEDGETLYTNRAFLDIYGYRDTAEFKITPVKDRYTPGSYVEFHERQEKRRRREPLPDIYEVSIVRKDGTVRQLQVFRKKILWGGKQQYQTIYQDITERQQMITRINELNDILQLISNINQLIVEIDNEGELLQKACNQFIESRQYLLSWVGFKQEGTYDIKPVAWAGEGADYLASVKITWDDSPLGHGPTGTAIKTSKPVVMRDIPHDPGFKPWRDHALQLGFISSVALPLVVQGKVIGVLGIYSGSTAAFNEKELELLIELGGDLSLGIEKIRNREERQRAEETIKESEEFLDNIIEKTPNPIWVSDEKGTIIRINQALRDLLKIKDEEIIGKYNVLKDTQVIEQGYLPLVKSVFEEGKTVHFTIDYKTAQEQQVTLKETTHKILEIVISNIRDKNGKVINAIAQENDITERMRAEEALAASEVSYRRLFESAKDGILIIDANTGLITDANPFLNNLLGLSLKEIKGRELWEIGTFTDIVSSKMRFEELQQKGYVRYEDLPLKTTDGRQISVEFVSNVYNVDHRRVIQCNIRDITERKRAEEEKQQAHILLKEAELIGKAGGWELNIDTGQQVWTEETARIHEVEPDFKPNLENGINFYTPASRTLVSQAVQRVIDHGESFDLELEIITAKGNLRNVRAIGHPDLEHRRVYGFFQDITEQKGVEEKLKAMTVRQRELLTAIPDIIMEVDNNKVYTWTNQAGFEFFGSDVIGKEAAFYFEGEQDTYAAVQPLFNGEESTFYVESWQRRKDGQKRLLAWWCRVLKDSQGNVRGALSSAQDITEPRQLQEVIIASEVRYRRLFEAAREGILILDVATGTIVDVNPFMIEMLGFSREKFLDKKIWELGFFKDIVANRDNFEELKRNNYITYENMPLETSTGQRIQMEFVSHRYDVGNRQVIQCNIRDITARKQAEQALKESEEKYRLIVEKSNDIVFTFNPAGEFLYISPSVKNMLGYNPADLIGRTFGSIVHPEDMHGLQQAIQRNIKDGSQTPGGNRYRVRHASGEWHWHNAAGNAVLDANGKFLSFVAIARDITEHKHAEEALQASENSFRNSLDNSPMGIHIVDNDWNTLYANRAFLDIYGYENIEELKATLQEGRYTPESYADWVLRHEKMVRGESVPDEIEADIVRKDGTIRHVQAFRKEVFWNGKQQYQLLYNDITERKRAEEALQESETRYHELVDTITSGVFIYKAVDNGENFVFVDVNNAAEKMEGISRKDIIGKKVTEVLPGSKGYNWFTVFQRVWQTGNPEFFSSGELQDERETGRWRDNWAYKLPSGEIVNVYDDITKRKRAEEALKASETSFRNSLDNSPLGIRIVDLEGQTLYANQALLTIFGYETADEIISNPPQEHFTPESYAGYFLRKEKRLRGESIPDSVEIDIERKDGTIRNLQVLPKDVVWNGTNQLQIIYNDITERKQAEEALKASEEKYSTLIEQSADGIVILDVHTIKFANRRINEVSGFSQDEILDKMFIDLVAPEFKEITAQSYDRELSTGTPNILELEMLNKDGRRIPVDTRALPIIYQGKPATMVTIRDITDRKQAEAALKASENSFRNSLDNSPMGIRISDRNDDTLYANQAFLNIFDFANIEELRASPPLKHYTPRAYADFVQRMEDQKRGAPRPDNVEIEIIRKDGNIRHLRLFTRELMWYGKQQFQNLYTDITERKQAEEALKASEEKYSTLIEKSSDGIVILDDHSIEFSNTRMCEMCGYSQKEILGKNFLDLVAPEYLEKLKERYQGVQADVLKTDNFEMEIITKDGRKIPVETSAQNIVYREKSATMVITRDITKRRLAEEAVKISEQNFRNSLDSSLMGIRIIDEKWHTLYANQVFLGIFGYEKVDEISTTALQDHYTPEEYARYLLRQEQRKRGEAVPENMKVDIVGKDGSIRHLEIYSNGVLWGDKQQRQVIYHDITERTQAEEELKASEQNFRNSIDSSSLGIRISDMENRTLYANQALLEIFGYKNIDEVIAKSPQEYYSPESYAEYLEMREKYGRGEIIPDQVDIDIIRKDGAVRHLQALFQLVLWNGKQQFQTAYNDVTERKKIEEALRESEEKYRLIVENTRDIIFIANVAGEFIYVSSSVKDILGYDQAELIGKMFLSLVHVEDKHILEDETARARVPGYQMSGDSEYRICHASGEWRWVISRGTRVADTNGQFLYFIGIIRDITLYKRAEKEKQILEEKAQVASRLTAVGEMAAGIAHEINNPLTGVLGFSQMLLENKNVPEDIKENLALIVDGSQRVADIVKRLLTFARQAKPVKSVANLNELIDNTLKLREYVLKTNSINVVTMFDPELPWSVVDPGQMQQVFLNLIVNAEQAMKKSHGKGTLTITTEKKENNIRISFQDDGPGITGENMGHLFEPFFTTKEPGEGTGLGLSLSRSIILEHNGKMSVDSEFGHGATFTVELPIIEALPSEVETPTPIVKEEKTITKKGRILVVDDEVGVRALLEKTLTRAGHSVDVIDDAREALNIIDAGTVYDVIVTDVRMPGMSGIELYPLLLRKMPSMKNRIIFITGDVMGLDIKTFLNENNLPYLAKPFDIELLKDKIGTILSTGQT